MAKQCWTRFGCMRSWTNINPNLISVSYALRGHLTNSSDSYSFWPWWKISDNLVHIHKRWVHCQSTCIGLLQEDCGLQQNCKPLVCICHVFDLEFALDLDLLKDSHPPSDELTSHLMLIFKFNWDLHGWNTAGKWKCWLLIKAYTYFSLDIQWFLFSFKTAFWIYLSLLMHLMLFSFNRLIDSCNT